MPNNKKNTTFPIEPFKAQVTALLRLEKYKLLSTRHRFAETCIQFSAKL